MTKSYVELINDTIQESGADLASYSLTGSDFNTNTDFLMRRFKTWVKRAWKTIQQEADDWQFLTSRAVVNVGPRIQFYTSGQIPGTIPPAIDIYNSDDIVKISQMPLSGMTDLTPNFTSDSPTGKSYGYIDIGDSYFPVNDTLKPGNDYFYLNGRIMEYEYGPNLNQFYANGISVGSILSIAAVRNSDQSDTILISNAITLTEMTPNTDNFLRGSTSFKFTTNVRELQDYIAGGDYTIGLFPLPTDQYTAVEYLTGGDPNNPLLFISEVADDLTGSLVGVKAYIHSWGSYDWNEELADNDFTDLVKGVNSSTYKIIRNGNPEPGSNEELPCIPWQSFLERVDSAQNMPADPAYISEDSQGRWRLWPAPKERVTITFDYIRSPQELTLYNDVPQHLDKEYEDLIMWRALMFYGQFAEQPSIILRAQKEYMNILYRFEKNKRPKFVFRPARFGRWADRYT